MQLTHEQASRIHGLLAILFYGLIAMRYLLNSLTRNVSGTVTDPAGMVWRLQDIYDVTGLMAIFTMGAFTILGLVKLMEVSPAPQIAPVEAAPAMYTVFDDPGRLGPRLLGRGRWLMIARHALGR